MMDTYTKIVLTLIAIALWGLLLMPIVAPEKLRASDIQDVNIVKVNGDDWYGSALPVDVTDSVDVTGSVNCY